MKLSDFKGISKKFELVVESVANGHEDYYVVTFKKPEGLEWRPGEHGIFNLSSYGVEGKKWRAFSVASIPSEDVVQVGTRTGETPSSFKQVLTHLKPGERVSVTGPFGWFTLQDESTPIVLIAGGVGITPIRALLKELERGNRRQVDVVFGAEGYYLYKEDIQQVAAKDENINLHLTGGIDETQASIREMVEKYGNQAYYYISGNMNMIKSTKKYLQSVGIKGRRMINDPFLGY
jgi:ferredoxin-NADP reductase